MTMHINLSPEMESYIKAKVGGGCQRRSATGTRRGHRIHAGAASECGPGHFEGP
jgi:hypothetical protein